MLGLSRISLSQSIRDKNIKLSSNIAQLGSLKQNARANNISRLGCMMWCKSVARTGRYILGIHIARFGFRWFWVHRQRFSINVMVAYIVSWLEIPMWREAYRPKIKLVTLGYSVSLDMYRILTNWFIPGICTTSELRWLSVKISGGNIKNRLYSNSSGCGSVIAEHATVAISN